MVGSRRRLGCCVRFSFLCDLGADAGAGTFFQLAIRGLPLCPWRYNPYRSRALVMVREVRDKRALAIHFTDAMLVGLAQVGALIPGVSRSGSTLTAALGLGFKRAEAARFSFLLGLPAIALAGLKELAELRHA